MIGYLQFWVRYPYAICGRAMASWIVRWTPDRAVLVGALAGGIMFCYWEHALLAVPFSTLMPGQRCDGIAPHPGGGREIFLVTSCNRNRNKLRFDRATQWLASTLNLFYL